MLRSHTHVTHSTCVLVDLSRLECFFFFYFFSFFFASLPLSWHKFLQIFNVAVGLVAGSLASFLLIYAWMGCLDAVFPHVFSTGQFYPKPLKNFADILFDQWYSKSGIPPPSLPPRCVVSVYFVIHPNCVLWQKRRDFVQNTTIMPEILPI